MDKYWVLLKVNVASARRSAVFLFTCYYYFISHIPEIETRFINIVHNNNVMVTVDSIILINHLRRTTVYWRLTNVCLQTLKYCVF